MSHAMPRGERLRLAAGDRHRVEIAEEVEDDLLAVGADVEAHPRPFGDVDRHVVRDRADC